MTQQHEYHDHQHGRGHPNADTGDSKLPGFFEIMETALRELLIERRHFSAAEIRRQIEVLDSRSEALGADAPRPARSENFKVMLVVPDTGSDK